jgi:hypothetical protein
MILQEIHRLNFVEFILFDIVLEAVLFQSLVKAVSWALRPSSA